MQGCDDFCVGVDGRLHEEASVVFVPTGEKVDVFVEATVSKEISWRIWNERSVRLWLEITNLGQGIYFVVVSDSELLRVSNGTLREQESCSCELEDVQPTSEARAEVCTALLVVLKPMMLV